ncbi:putative zinc-binding dehydrogenase family oxidoreductase [Lineolata rhizophorae]|uniref:Putative zinc-binding dehydrogenase family oxidoreductase n=1 Tax=Lineolata rhizophorae TaxID=578093 RepID=A0A6A6P8S2_9PEZI|nr:putative zinc-binding dehydrogenase family oxidoreductase [Lineolata rhizophorae]
MPGTQTCAWVEKPAKDARVEIRSDHPMPADPGHGEVLVKVEVTGVCHSDCHNIYGETPMHVHIAGHEGVGRIVKLGAGVDPGLMNKRVGLPWILKSCGDCEVCAVDPLCCPNQVNHGRNTEGCFQQYVLAPARDIPKLPEGLAAEIIAPLLCGGVTTYSAIKKANLRPGNFLVIPGAGGGLGHLGLQIAKAQGIQVIAIDSGAEKRDLCKRLGAAHFIDFKDSDVVAKVKGITGMGAHAVVVVPGSPQAYEQALPMLRNRGVMVCVGLPNAEFAIKVRPIQMVVMGLTIVGSSVGSHNDMADLIYLASQGVVVPEIEVYEFAQLEEVLQKLMRYEVKGRAVVRLPA